MLFRSVRERIGRFKYVNEDRISQEFEKTYIELEKETQNLKVEED